MNTKTKPQTRMMLICVLHFIAARSAAMINVREGSFVQTSVDLDRTSEHDDLKIERTYNSRSAHDGIFGFGWCSPFETRLRALPGGRFALRDCGAASEIIYQNSPAKPDQWLATNAPGERLLDSVGASPGRFTRRTGRGEIQTFSEKTGRLIGITDRAGRILELRYDGDGRLIEVGPPGKKAFGFVYDASGLKINRVDSPGRTSVQYAYLEADLVTVDGVGRLGYRYDDLHNLMQIKTGGRVSDEMFYDKEQDRLVRAIRLLGADACVDSLNYHPTRSRLEVETSTRCGARAAVKKHFEFWYGGDLSGLRSLARMRVDSGRGFTEFSFDPRDGSATTINHNGAVTRLANSATGLMP